LHAQPALLLPSALRIAYGLAREFADRLKWLDAKVGITKVPTTSQQLVNLRRPQEAVVSMSSLSAIVFHMCQAIHQEHCVNAV
jgi:hypothetical protein